MTLDLNRESCRSRGNTMADEKELRVLWSFTKELWTLIKKYYGTKDLESEDFWHGLAEDCRDAVEAHGSHRLCIHLVHGLIDYFEEARKEAR